MFCLRHHASNHSFGNRDQQNANKTALPAVTTGPLHTFSSRWGWHGRCLVRCTHAISSSSSSASSVRTAVPAPSAHELTCEATSNSVQDLLLVQVVRSSQQRAHKQQGHHVQQQQQQQQQQQLLQPAHHQLSILEEQLHTQPSYVQSARARTLQQQQQQQQHCQQADQVVQHQPCQEVHTLEQQLQQWQQERLSAPEQQQQHQQHRTELLEPLQSVRQQADAVKESHQRQQQQQQQEQEQAQGLGVVGASAHRQSRTNRKQPKAVSGAAAAGPSIQKHDEADLLADAPSSLAPRQQCSRQIGVLDTCGWSRAELLQGWRYRKAENIARTPYGYAMVRTSAGSQPHSLAAQLRHWLQQEQHAVLSAAGAGRTLAALEAVAELIQQQQQQQQQAPPRLLVTPHVRSCSRPQGGRCQVYTLQCQLLPAADEQQSMAAPGALQPERQQQQERWQVAAEGHSLGCNQLQQQREQQHVLCLTQQQGQSWLPDLQELHAHVAAAAEQHQRRRRHQQQQQQQEEQHLQQRRPQQASTHSCAVKQLNGFYHSPVAAACPSVDVLQLPMCQAGVLAVDQRQQHLQHHVNGNSAANKQHWQQHGLEVELQQQQLASCSHNCLQPQKQHPPGTVKLPPQQWQQRQQQQQSEQASHSRLAVGHHSQARPARAADAAVAASAPAATGVRELEVRGSCIALADALEHVLLECTAVCMPVAYDKQAAKLLEAAALLNRRWQQRSSSGAAAAGHRLQLVLQPLVGWVQRQSGLRPGLHVYVFAVPSVQ